MTEGRVSKFEDRSKEIIQPNEKKKKKRKQSEKRPTNLWDNTEKSGKLQVSGNF